MQVKVFPGAASPGRSRSTSRGSLLERSGAPPRAPRSGTRGRLSAVRLTGTLVVILALLLPATLLVGSVPVAIASESTPPALHPSLAAQRATPSLGFNPPCYPIAATICVSAADTLQPNILPPFGSFVATTQPAATKNINLYVKSRSPLNYTNAPKNGPYALMQLNVTGTLWNGNPYYSGYTGDIWHSNNNTPYWSWSGSAVQNASYPYWYSLQFTANSSSGVPNFYPGMHVAWWIAFYTYNGSTRVSWTSPTFQFTFAGAWAYSPYPGSTQYAGSSAAAQDVHVTITPAAPNWNDSVTAIINTTASDGPPVEASIGKAYWVLSESGPNGSELQSTTFAFPVPFVSLLGGAGASTTRLTLPASWAQTPGSTVDFNFVVYDTANDQIQTPAESYVVGGNGSFSSGSFGDDLNLAASPAALLTSFNSSVTPGAPVPLTLVSRDPTTAILAAQVSATFTYPEIGETASFVLPMVRDRSTEFAAAIPAFPVGSDVAFTVEAWDFSQREEVSPMFSYSVPTLGTLIPDVPANSTFLYVYVYDNGTHTWVSNAQVTITGLSKYLHLVSLTSYGVAYPNVSDRPLVPTVIPANTSYLISVSDPSWLPTARTAGPTLNVTLVLAHSLTARGPLQVGSNYAILLEGDALMFYLNATPLTPVPSPPATATTAEFPPVVGLLAAVAVAVPVVLWWRRVRARRTEEERRITL